MKVTVPNTSLRVPLLVPAILAFTFQAALCLEPCRQARSARERATQTLQARFATLVLSRSSRRSHTARITGRHGRPGGLCRCRGLPGEAGDPGHHLLHGPPGGVQREGAGRRAQGAVLPDGVALVAHRLLGEHQTRVGALTLDTTGLTVE